MLSKLLPNNKLIRLSSSLIKRQFSQVAQASQQLQTQSISQKLTSQGDKQTKYHEHYRFDSYNDIRHDKKWQQRIIKREDDNFERWVELVTFHYDQWRKHVFGRSDPQIQVIPEKSGDYIYFVQPKEFSVTSDKKDKGTYEVYYRHKFDLYGKFDTIEEAKKNTEVIMDLEEVPFISQRSLRKTLINKVKMNDDHSMIAFTLDIGNTERLTGGVKDMKTNQVLMHIKLENISQIEFGRGRDILYYVETDSMNRPCKVKQLNIQTMKEQTLFVDTDPTHYIDISITKDKRYMLISSCTKEDAEVWVVDRDLPGDQIMTPTKLIQRRPGVKAHVEHLRDFFIMISNYGVKSKNYKLTTLQDKDFQSDDFNDKWEDLLTSGDQNISNDGFIIQEFDGFKDFIAVYIKNQGRPEILIQDLNTKQFNSIKVDDVGEIVPGLNQDYESSTLRYQYTSPFVYEQVFEYNHQTKNQKMVKEYKLQGSPQIVRNKFDCKQFLVPSHDGETVPLNIYFKKGIPLDRKNRTIIKGYGAYGINLHQGFNIINTSAMEKGWVIAQAMVRGGGEKGIYWHEQGKLNKKHNSFKDFIACAEYLIANRITHPNLLAAKGSSAGGTLVAQACLNMHPELFRACILNVPFLDVLSTLLDDTLPLTVTDHLEFGNPINDANAYKLISSYSPFENLSHQEYPSVLMNISLKDPRVPHWSSLKYIEKLRDLAKEPKRFPDFGAKNIIVRFQKEGGHFGEVDNEVNLAMGTFEFAWLDYIMFKKNNLIS